MYEWARVYLAEKGFAQYEISNFSLPGKACRHNLIYWRQQDYLGLGVGAVGCMDGFAGKTTRRFMPIIETFKRSIFRAPHPKFWMKKSVSSNG